VKLNKAQWHKKYREALIALAGMTSSEALKHMMDNENPFDYGYSPTWYVLEEMAVKKDEAIEKVLETFKGKVVNAIR
jgi:hypothetical protein